MSNDNKLLFQDFGPVSQQEWKDKAIVDLKGADFNKKLVWRNLNELEFQPFYILDKDKEFLANTGINSSAVTNYRRIVVSDESVANKQAIKAIEEGITGLLFDLKNNVSAYELLDGISLNDVTVSFILREKEVDFATEFFALVNENGIDYDRLNGYFDLDIMYDYVTRGNVNCDLFDKVVELVKLSENYPNFKGISISGSVYLDSGANQVQEIAYTLNSLILNIDKYTNRGLEIQTIFDNLHFELAIGAEYFVEIAKFRAFNHLLKQIALKYGVEEFDSNFTAKTSVWTKSVTDANTNMLRATTEAMAAMLGNIDGVEIDPYDKELDQKSDFSNRISGNIATILKEESYFGKVANPVDGSYYIEELTYQIAEKALELFKIIEENGGYYKCFESERIQKQIAEIRFKKIKLISQRRLAMVGVNKYPNLMEEVNSSKLSDLKNGSKSIDKVLKPRRATLEIESLRRNTEVFVEAKGFRPIVELASFGHLAMRKARAGFAYDFTGVSGYDVQQEKSFENAAIAAEESAKSNSNVVVICSSDDDYNESALTLVESFRKITKDKVLLLAGNPVDLKEKLQAAGLDGFINVKSDVIETIAAVQNKINDNF